MHPQGVKIAHALARAGLASRRDSEALVRCGHVLVNGALVTTPAVRVMDTDTVVVDGVPLPAPAVPRMWAYYKPVRMLTSARDRQKRATVFAALPKEIGRVISVGRLDFMSEGLLLLTNNSTIKRYLEAPHTKIERTYRVRIHGGVSESHIRALRRGLALPDTRAFLPMRVQCTHQQGTHQWLTITLLEGRNREIRRAIAAGGGQVSRLIRTHYGAFALGDMRVGELCALPSKATKSIFKQAEKLL